MVIKLNGILKQNCETLMCGGFYNWLFLHDVSTDNGMATPQKLLHETSTQFTGQIAALL